jgi:hypothetical protein
MDLDELRHALDEAGKRSEVDLAIARAEVGARANRRRRRQRSFASALVLVGAVAIVALVLVIAGSGPTREPVGVTASTNATYGRLPPRSEAAIAYDQARSRVVLFGGFDGSRTLADTWLWDGHGWVPAHPADVPPARERAAMAYDPATRDIVLFGGTVQRYHQRSLALNDTWTWDGAAWTRRHPLHEPPWSTGLAMSYDPRSHSVLLVTLPSSHPNLDLTPDGVGSRGTTAFGTWRWDGSDWRELPTPSAPAFAAGAVFHTNPRLATLPNGAGLLFYSWSVYMGSCPPPGRCGSGPDPNGTRNSQTWTWDGSGWTEQHPSRAPGYAQLVATPGAGAAPIIFTGDATTWQWTGSDWAETRRRGPAPYDEGLAVYDEADANVVAYAGRLGSDGAFYDTWIWDGSWSKQSGSIAPVTTTAPPAPTTTSTVPTLGACTSAQLDLTLDRDLGSLMAQPGAFFRLKNTSAMACTLDGYPMLALYDASGHLIPTAIRHGNAYQINDPGPHRVTVRPDQSAYFGFGWSDVNQPSGRTNKGCVSIARVSVVVPNAQDSLTTAARLQSLLCPGGSLVSAIAARDAFTIASP